ncbi:MAG: dUTP diphosphatase [Thermoanaerobaculia bacterium]|nr:dUTP diphosphatase [Thermoanaerobaculia bacterium]
MAEPEVPLRVRRLAHAASLPLPEYASAGSAGLDLRAAVGRSLTLAPGERTLVPTGLVLEIPDGWEGQVRPRSGLAVRHGISLVNTPGTIDSDYRGEVKLPVINLGAEPFTIERGARLAQLVLARVTRVRVEEVEAVTPTRRGEGGFGSTGTG